ncbi:MAG: GNAT family N-acetyltransferase [Cytophagales bacterium]|nr:GNAT family N-acetyltransferase [Cytophagales bacterium]
MTDLPPQPASSPGFTARFAHSLDEKSIIQLYQAVAAQGGGIAREADEVTAGYVAGNLEKATANGICLVVDHPDQPGAVIAEVHCYKLIPRVFSHVLSELTAVVHPDFQGRGLGKLLFTALLAHVEAHRLDILRVELIARESNGKAIALYEKLGFVTEGRLAQRINGKTGVLEADIPMAWFNKNFGKAPLPQR